MLVCTPLAPAILIAMLGTATHPRCRSSNAPRTRRHAHGGDDQAAAAGDDPVGVGDHRPAGTILGLLIGVFFAWALVLAMKNQGITVVSLPVLSLVIVVLLAALAGVAAAILPSRQAAKLNVLKAIVTD